MWKRMNRSKIEWIKLDTWIDKFKTAILLFLLGLKNNSMDR